MTCRRKDSQFQIHGHQVFWLLSSKSMDTKTLTIWPGDGKDALCPVLTPPLLWQSDLTGNQTVLKDCASSIQTQQPGHVLAPNNGQRHIPALTVYAANIITVVAAQQSHKHSSSIGSSCCGWFAQYYVPSLQAIAQHPNWYLTTTSLELLLSTFLPGTLPQLVFLTLAEKKYQILTNAQHLFTRYLTTSSLISFAQPNICQVFDSCSALFIWCLTTTSHNQIAQHICTKTLTLAQHHLLGTLPQPVIFTLLTSAQENLSCDE